MPQRMRTRGDSSIFSPDALPKDFCALLLKLSVWKIQIETFACKVLLFEFLVLLIIRKRERKEGEGERKEEEKGTRGGKEGKREGDGGRVNSFQIPGFLLIFFLV